MRAYSLVLMVFIFSLSLSIVNNLAIIPTGVGEIGFGSSGQSAENYISSRNQLVGSTAGVGTTSGVDTQATFSWLNTMYRIVVVGIPLVVGIFFDCTFGLPLLLTAVGVPAVLAYPLGIMGWAIYLFGMFQWITGRSFREHK